MASSGPQPAAQPAPQRPYLRPSAGVQAEEILEIKRSQFIGIARRVASEEQAREFINEVRQSYPDARHHCSAYVVHVDCAQPIERSSDDGEPSGTAGQPMLEVLKGWTQDRGLPLRDVAVVVVRYFGGVLLGTGGLVRAYQDATRAALAGLPLARRRQLSVYRLHLDHGRAGKMEAEIRAAGYEVIDLDYGVDVALSVATEPDVDFAAFLAKISGGTTHPAGEPEMQWVESRA